MNLLGDDGCDISRPDHAERDAGHDVDEIHGAFAQRRRQHQPAALKGDQSDRGNRTPQDDVDNEGGAHGGASFGYMRT
jgi:hypothetical protein